MEESKQSKVLRRDTKENNDVAAWWVLPRGSSMREVRPGRKYKDCLRDQAPNQERPAVPAELKQLHNVEKII